MTNYLLDLKNAKNSTLQAKCLELFYDDTSHLVFNFCRRKGLSLENSEDISQIVYTQIYKKRDLYDPKHSPLAWLYVITKSETKDYLKKEAIYTNYLTDYGLFLDMSQNDDDSPIRDVELGKLSDTERKVIESRYLKDQDFSTIADDLGLTQTNVRKIVSRALVKLKG